MERKLKVIKRFSFRSKNMVDEPVKYIVSETECGLIHIDKRWLTENKKFNKSFGEYTLIRKFKRKCYVSETTMIKKSSLSLIAYAVFFAGN